MFILINGQVGFKEGVLLFGLSTYLIFKATK